MVSDSDDDFVSPVKEKRTPSEPVPGSRKKGTARRRVKVLPKNLVIFGGSYRKCWSFLGVVPKNVVTYRNEFVHCRRLLPQSQMATLILMKLQQHHHPLPLRADLRAGNKADGIFHCQF